MNKKIQTTDYRLQTTVKQKTAVDCRRWTVDSKKGFTLIEILVAISILAVIGVVSVPNLRKFNENQILQNTTNDLVRTLRDAQSSANSHVQCTNILRAREWVVDIGASTYQLEANCYDPASNSAFPAPEAHYSPTPTVVNGVAFTLRTPTSPCDSPRKVAFGAEYMPYQQNRFSNVSFICSNLASPSPDNTLEIKLTKNSVDQYICIDKGGSINASSIVCF